MKELSEENSKQNKKDVIVELLRIIAICMVVGTHLKLPFYNSDGILKTNLIISCFVGDGVAIFWLILGFFYFKNDDYKQKIKKMFKKIIIPLFICSAFMFYFYPYIIGESTFLESISHSIEEYKNLFTNGLLKWQNAINGCNYLWYLYVYVLAILIFPALKGIKEYIDKSKIKPLYIVGILLFLLIINDYSLNSLFEFSHHTFNGVLGASIWIIIGYILYKNRGYFINNIKIGLLGLITFIVMNLLRSNIVLKSYSIEPIFWYTSYAVIAILGLVIFLFSISDNINKTKILSKIINKIGGLTFYIYLIHQVVLGFLNSRGINEKILNLFNNNSLLYEIIYIIVVFTTSLIISYIISIINKGIKFLFKYKEVKK